MLFVCLCGVFYRIGFCVGVGVYLLVDNVNVFERHKND